MNERETFNSGQATDYWNEKIGIGSKKKISAKDLFNLVQDIRKIRCAAMGADWQEWRKPIELQGQNGTLSLDWIPADKDHPGYIQIQSSHAEQLEQNDETIVIYPKGKNRFIILHGVQVRFSPLLGIHIQVFGEKMGLTQTPLSSTLKKYLARELWESHLDTPLITDPIGPLNPYIATAGVSELDDTDEARRFYTFN